MIIVLLPSDEPEDVAAEVCRQFASVVHSRTPDDHSIDLHAGSPRKRAVCGDLDCGGRTGRVIPTTQGLCPTCGGSVTSIEEVDRLRDVFARGRALGLYSPEEADAHRTRVHIPVA